MPAISTMVYPAPAYVRVETNWADVGQAVRAAVYRVDCLTGQRVPLRPYVSFSGDFLDLSCGYGIFWDTEPQLDRCVYYCTQAQDRAGSVVTKPSDYIAYDTFTRTVAAGSWGTSTSGRTYTLGGTATDFSVNGAQGSILFTGVVGRRTILNGVTKTSIGFRGNVRPEVVAAGAPVDLGYALRTDMAGNNAYEILVRFEVAGTTRLRVNQNVGGVATNIGDVSIPYLYSSGSGFTIVAEMIGSQLVARAFDAATPDPMTPQLTITNSLISSGSAGAMARIQAGNLNTPFTGHWDEFYVYDPCAGAVTVETCSGDLVVPSSGNFRLGDPVRPCNDVTLLFDAPVDPDCVPTQGIFFGNMAEETFAADTSSFLPVNAKFPIVANRTRRGVASTLTVASRTFADRDALRRLNEPNSPLLIRGPAQYGINDRYMSVSDVMETRPVSDHRVQPRAVAMPHFEVARPAGPSQGVCGTRVKDLCDIYPTWDAIVAAGLTWADLLRGKASGDTPKPATVERTWNDVNSTYANWNAVNSGNADWDDLLDGA